MRNEDIVTGVLAVVGNVIAIVGNTLLCFTIYRSSRLRTPTNVFIAALAIIGLLFAVFIGPSITVTLFAGGQYIFGQHFCNFQAFTALFIEFATLHTIALTAFNRFCRMTKPHWYAKIFPSKRRSSVILVLTWAIQIGFISAFSLPSFSKFEFNARRVTCVLVFDSTSSDIIYCTIKTAFYFAVTSVVVVYCYCKVFFNIRDHTRKVSSTFSRTRERVNVEEIKITRTVFGVVMFFLICWIPEYILSMIIRLQPNLLHPIVDRIVVFFLFLSSSLTPWVYAVTNRQFRAEFKRLLICKLRKETEIVEIPETTA